MSQPSTQPARSRHVASASGPCPARWFRRALVFGALLSVLPPSIADAQGLNFQGRLRIDGRYARGDVRYRDIDGDGRLDVYSAGDDGDKYINYSVSRNVGNGALRPVLSVVQSAGLGDYPEQFDVADFDGDGDLDLVLGWSYGRIDVHFNVGNDPYWPPAEYHPGGMRALGVADLDGDGDSDIVCAGAVDGFLRILENDGLGGFAIRTSQSVGSTVQALQAVDLDLDGDVDLAVVDFTPGLVRVLANDGSANFSAPDSYALGTRPTDLRSADFDGDGDRDLVVANYNSSSVSVLSNLGAGVFAPAVSYAAGPGCDHLEVADFDANGAPDIAVTGGGRVSVLLNVAGVFPAVQSCGESLSRQLAALDIDDDGDLDLAVGNGEAVRNAGDGVFQVSPVDAYSDFQADWRGADIAAADLDGDGDRDVAIASTRGLVVRTNLGGDLFSPLTTYTATSALAGELLLTDVDGDLDLDAVLSRATLVLVFQNDGTGVFLAPIQIHSPTLLTKLLPGDLGGDGLPELIGMSASGFFAATNLGGASFAAFASVPAQASASGGARFDVGDFDGDGDVDLASANASLVRLHVNQGNGTFGAAVPIATIGGVVELVGADLDGDGDRDLALMNTAGPSVLLNAGAGMFAAPIALHGTPGRLMVEDFDQDGDFDLACVVPEAGPVDSYAGNSLDTYENLGGGTFGAPRPVGVAHALSIAAGDTDGDQDLDLLAITPTTFSIVENSTRAGVTFCAGDGSATACPCGGTSAAGVGCPNSTGAGGALVAVGPASLLSSTLRLRGSQMPDSLALYVQGTAATNGGAGTVLGDGLRCAGGTVRRLALVRNVGGASTMPAAGAPSLSTLGQVTSQGERVYQVWYRNAVDFCTPSTFNSTNGVRIVWGL